MRGLSRASASRNASGSGREQQNRDRNDSLHVSA
jgi:hypothetical protein